MHESSILIAVSEHGIVKINDESLLELISGAGASAPGSGASAPGSGASAPGNLTNTLCGCGSGGNFRCGQSGISSG